MRPFNPTPGHISREKHSPARCMHGSVHCSTVYHGQDTETQMSTDRGAHQEVGCAPACAQSRPTLCDPCAVAHQAPLSLRILQARILDWVVMPSFRGR